MDFQIQQRVALVCGAGSGLGQAIALSLAQEGVKVAVTGRSAEKLAQTVERITLLGGTARAWRLDLAAPEQFDRVIADIRERWGDIDILVNNAGRQQYCESIETLTTAAFDATFKTNVYAPFWITKAALRHLSQGAAIINTSSVQAFKPSEILLDYAQTKACNVAFTKSLAKQLGPRGIRVNAVAPGPYWTPLQSSGGQPQEKVQHFGEDTPLGRPGQPVEIAPLYVLLASDACSYASGQVWCSDGGTGVA